MSLSKSAWNALTGLLSMRVTINWSFVNCSPIINGVNPKLTITEGSDEWWSAFQVTNSANGVKSLLIQGNGGTWAPLNRSQTLWIGIFDYDIPTPVSLQMVDNIGSIHTVNLIDISSTSGTTVDFNS